MSFSKYSPNLTLPYLLTTYWYSEFLFVHLPDSLSSWITAIVAMTDAHWIVNTSLSYSSPYPYVAVGPLTACTSDLCGFYDLANHDVVSASDLNSALSHTADLFPDSGFKASFYTWDIPSLLLILVMLIISSTTCCWCCVVSSYHISIPITLLLIGLNKVQI